MEMYAGIDLASEEHRLCVVDGEGRQLEQRRIRHDEVGIDALCRRLVELGVSRVALERPDGLVVDRLLDAGLTVVAVHPNQLAATRDRYSVRLRVLEPDADQTKALRALTRSREDLVQARVALANQLRAQLEAFWPGAGRIFSDVDSPITLAFLERYPSPNDARGLGEKRLAGFLARHGYCGRKSAAELLERLRSAPQARTGELEAEARRQVVLAIVAALRPLVEQIRLLTGEIRGLLADHPDGQIFRSLFRDPKSVVTAAGLLAEIGDCRNRYPTRDALAADAGMSPVAVESGKRKVACFRYACDKRLRDAVSTLADASRKHNPWAHDVYQRALARGHDHPHAIRILGRAWLRVIWQMWQDRAPYDPMLHGNLQRLIPRES